MVSTTAPSYRHGMEPITIPTPDQLRQRIAECERERRALQRMLRLSQAATDADEARRARQRHEEASRGD